ncbi:11421_t:CDS:2, partial [Funneliformis mosseae]
MKTGQLHDWFQDHCLPLILLLTLQHPVIAEWTHAQIRILIDKRRTRNDVFYNLRRNQKRFWGSIASKINQENGSSFNGHQCKEKFSNLVQDYNLCVILCLVKVKPKVEQVHDILMNFVHIFGRDLRMNSIESAVLILLTEDEIESLPVRRSTIPPVSSLTTNDEMDISDTEQLVDHRRTSLYEELH